MDIKKYIYGHCITPVRIKSFDAYSNSFIMRDVPCGKCLHCRNNHVNEWITRLYAQAQYSRNVYFISLDYRPFDLTSPVARTLAAETAAVYHNVNMLKTYGMHPLVLCKNHLQDFFKRLRRNTSKSIQYFACGEYGTHAGGKGFGRPHFHIILFSNDEITHQELIEAWTIHGYSIGRVDYQLLRKDNLYLEHIDPSTSAKFCFRYVCKYLQKSDFDFEKLATINYHRAFYKSLKSFDEVKTDLFTTTFTENLSMVDYTWDDYIKDYSPFTCCSKRPSIGSGYLNENMQRFTAGDFRLFGLPDECPATFPRYFIKKAKDAICPIMAIGSISNKVSSNSRITHIAALLREIYDSRLDMSLFGNNNAIVWNKGRYLGEPCLYRSPANNKADFDAYIKYNDLHMYDYSTNTFYQFCGYGYYTWRKIKGIGYVREDYKDIIDVLNYIQPFIDNLRSKVLEPFHYNKVLQEEDLYSTISVLFGSDINSYDKFITYVRGIYDTELSSVYRNQLLSNNSKISF